MTGIRDHGMTQGFALKILCFAYSSLHPKPLKTTDLFTVSIVLPLPERHIVRIIQYIAFSGRLLSFNLNLNSTRAYHTGQLRSMGLALSPKTGLPASRLPSSNSLVTWLLD